MRMGGMRRTPTVPWRRDCGRRLRSDVPNHRGDGDDPMREDQAKALEVEACMAAGWIQVQRETAAELLRCAEEARIRAREAVIQAQRVRALVAARRIGVAPADRRGSAR